MNEPASIAGLGDALRVLFAGGSLPADATFVAAVSALAIALVHATLGARLVRISILVRDVATLFAPRARGDRDASLRRELDRTFSGSLLSETWSELSRRRREFDAQSPDERSAARLAELLVERPLIPFGVRRRLLRSLPALLASLGGAATLASLAGGLASVGAGAPIAPVAGLALRGAFVGLLFATLAAALASVLEGAADALGARLCQLVERSHRSITPIEAQLRGAEAQRQGFERVSALFVQVAQDLRDSLDRGLARIERSTASAANLVGEEQRRVLELVIDELSGLVRRGVDEHVGALRSSLERATAQQTALDQRMATTIGEVARSAEGNARVAGTLERAAEAMDEAAGTIAGSAADLKPLVGHLGEVAAAIERAAIRVGQVQAMQLDGDGAQSSALAALRTDIARIGDQLARGAGELRRTVAPPERPAPASRPERGDVAPDDLASELARIEERTARSTDGAAARAPIARIDLVPIAAVPPIAEAQPASPEGDSLASASANTVGRSGFSALLSRYKAPQFSIDELPEPLRDFDADELSERAQTAPAPHDEAAASEARASEAQTPPAASDESEEERRRRRLDRFLGRR